MPQPPVRRELITALALGALLVLARSAVYILYEQSFFDSDQAIVGLMAKHLVEGRAFPLFYYGQIYMLAVDAWVSAPLFAVLGPTVGALHLSITLCNVLVAGLLIIGLHRYGGLRPFHALVATSFFVFAPPLPAAWLIEAGANIGPLVYVLLLWMLRDRPLWFGAVLGFGFVNREFTIYAVPVLLLLDAVQGRLFHVARLRTWLVAAVAAIGTWQAIQALTPFADMMGPHSRGELTRSGVGAQLSNISERVVFTWSDVIHRTSAMFHEHLPRLYGTARVDEAVAVQGHHWMFWPWMIVMTLAAMRVALLCRSRATLARVSFAAYLLGVGLVAVAVPLLTRGADSVADRYLLLAVYIPVGIIGALLIVEPRPALRRAAIGFVGLWMMTSAVDHAHQVARYAGGHEPNPKRELVDALLARHIDVAESNYWRAYSITFLARERVKIASTDVERISEYERLANAAGTSLVTIEEAPCPGGEQVSLWYLCRRHE